MIKIKIYYAGESVDAGIYVCLNCGKKVWLENNEMLATCSKCGQKTFTRETKK